jgi:hypothetical protein
MCEPAMLLQFFQFNEHNLVITHSPADLPLSVNIDLLCTSPTFRVLFVASITALWGIGFPQMISCARLLAHKHITGHSAATLLRNPVMKVLTLRIVLFKPLFDITQFSIMCVLY